MNQAYPGRSCLIIGSAAFSIYGLITYCYPEFADQFAFSSLSTVAICVGVMSLATNPTGNWTWTRPICPTGFSIYLWHLPIILVGYKLWGRLNMPHSAMLELLMLCAVAFVGSVVAHRVIATSPILRWMWMEETFPSLGDGIFVRRGVGTLG